MNAKDTIAELLSDANLMADWYKKNLAEATTQQLYEALNHPEKAKVIRYLTKLLEMH